MLAGLPAKDRRFVISSKTVAAAPAGAGSCCNRGGSTGRFDAQGPLDQGGLRADDAGKRLRDLRPIPAV